MRYFVIGVTNLICGRDVDKSKEACKQARAKSYSFVAYPVNIAAIAGSAGRSICRVVESSFDRFHNYERTVQLNYFDGPWVTMGFRSGMTAKKIGHVVNISSIGVLANAPSFSSYGTFMAALDGFDALCRQRVCLSGRALYYHQYAAVAHPPIIASTCLGTAGQLLLAVLPHFAQIAMNTSFRMFPDSGAAKGAKPGEKLVKQQLSPEAVALQQMMRGIHF